MLENNIIVALQNAQNIRNGQPNYGNATANNMFVDTENGLIRADSPEAIQWRREFEAQRLAITEAIKRWKTEPLFDTEFIAKQIPLMQQKIDERAKFEEFGYDEGVRKRKLADDILKQLKLAVAQNDAAAAMNAWNKFPPQIKKASIFHEHYESNAPD